jgi:hypothetical protein
MFSKLIRYLLGICKMTRGFKMPGDGLVLEEGPVEAAPVQELPAHQELLLHMASPKPPATNDV